MTSATTNTNTPKCKPVTSNGVDPTHHATIKDVALSLSLPCRFTKTAAASRL